ncbi:MAG: hypothetical protein MUE49_01320 [Rhodospirillales bacterium]|jgi:hypothetical protein|nr:hypothetical protein [Rhodospirillales bacterium]
MSSTQVAPLFDLRVTHAFYTDGRCADFAIEPTAAASATMRGLRLICKPAGDQIRVFAGLNPAGQPFASLASPPTLEFLLRLRSPNLPLFTELGDVDGKAAPVFTNSGVAVADPLSLRLIDRPSRAAETLTVQRPDADETFVLAGRPRPDSTLADLAVAAGGAVTGIKAYDPARRQIRVDSRAAAAGEAFSLSYPVLPPRRPDVFADVAIVVDDALLQASLAAGRPRRFQIPFAAKAVSWCYYLVTTLPTPLAQLRIVDASPGNGAPRIVFGDGGRREVSAQPDAGDAVALDLARRHGGRRIIRFVSDAPVPCRQSPVKNLELHAGANRLFAALPNPGLHNFAALRVAGPSATPAREVLYEVVTVIAD